MACQRTDSNRGGGVERIVLNDTTAGRALPMYSGPPATVQISPRLTQVASLKPRQQRLIRPADEYRERPEAIACALRHKTSPIGHREPKSESVEGPCVEAVPGAIEPCHVTSEGVRAFVFLVTCNPVTFPGFPRP